MRLMEALKGKLCLKIKIFTESSTGDSHRATQLYLRILRVSVVKNICRKHGD